MFALILGSVLLSFSEQEKDYVQKYDELLAEYEEYKENIDLTLEDIEKNYIDPAYDIGYETGYKDGLEDGYNDGMSDAYSIWEIGTYSESDLEEVYDRGFGDGQNDGYNAGYIDAINGVPTPTPNLELGLYYFDDYE